MTALPISRHCRSEQFACRQCFRGFTSVRQSRYLWGIKLREQCFEQCHFRFVAGSLCRYYLQHVIKYTCRIAWVLLLFPLLFLILPGKQFFQTNDVVDLAKKFAKKSFFVHLRSTEIKENGDFVEASHLGGRANLTELIRIFEKENLNVPMRVDHGKLMLNDVAKNYNPGYSFLGRMFALAQVEGMMAVVRNEIETGIIWIWNRKVLIMNDLL